MVLIALLFLTALFIPIECSAEASSTPPWQPLFQQIDVNGAGIGIVRSDSVELIENRLPDHLGGLVSLSSPIPSNSKTVAPKKAEAKRNDAEQWGSKDGIDWFQLFLPLLWLVVGVALGGGFGDWRAARPKRQSADRSGASR